MCSGSEAGSYLRLIDCTARTVGSVLEGEGRHEGRVSGHVQGPRIAHRYREPLLVQHL